MIAKKWAANVNVALSNQNGFHCMIHTFRSLRWSWWEIIVMKKMIMIALLVWTRDAFSSIEFRWWWDEHSSVKRGHHQMKNGLFILSYSNHIFFSGDFPFLIIPSFHSLSPSLTLYPPFLCCSALCTFTSDIRPSPSENHHHHDERVFSYGSYQDDERVQKTVHQVIKGENPKGRSSKSEY